MPCPFEACPHTPQCQRGECKAADGQTEVDNALTEFAEFVHQETGGKVMIWVWLARFKTKRKT